MRLAAVAGTSSSLTPNASATILARSTSKPSSSRFTLLELNGGTSENTTTRITPFDRISENRSACATALVSANATTATDSSHLLNIIPPRESAGLSRRQVKHRLQETLQLICLRLCEKL